MSFWGNKYRDTETKRLMPTLCLCVSVFVFSFGSTIAQPGNAEIYQQLLSEYLSGAPAFRAISGAKLVDHFPAVALDSTSAYSLQVLPPRLDYEVLDDKRIKRSLSIPLTERDSVLRPVKLSFEDTLERRDFHRIYRQSPDVLRGDDPTLRAKWIRPIGLIGLSVITFVGLFYVRSR
jgi:hypothetical protein